MDDIGINNDNFDRRAETAARRTVNFHPDDRKGDGTELPFILSEKQRELAYGILKAHLEDLVRGYSQDAIYQVGEADLQELSELVECFE